MSFISQLGAKAHYQLTSAKADILQVITSLKPKKLSSEWNKAEPETASRSIKTFHERHFPILKVWYKKMKKITNIETEDKPPKHLYILKADFGEGFSVNVKTQFPLQAQELLLWYICRLTSRIYLQNSSKGSHLWQQSSRSKQHACLFSYMKRNLDILPGDKLC